MTISAARHSLRPIIIPPPSSRSSTSPNTSPRFKSSVSTLLSYFETPGVPPPFARVDPVYKGVLVPSTRLWQIWKYGAAAAGKGIEVAGDILSHNLYGPPKPSWGIEMTILSSVMRDASRHSHLVDISFIRWLMGLSGLMPLPSDALVSPVTFRVRKRHLRGILAEHDALENGRRELAGEWVVGKRLWRRLQSEWKSKQRESQSDDVSATYRERTERVILYVHGGAYYMFDATTHRLLTIPLSKHVDARVFAINYRLAPETRFPGPLHDVVSSYFRLIDDLHIPPENVIVAGDSAGGALCLALLMYLRDNQYSLPAGAMLFSPWVDLTMSCDSWDSNYQFDIVPRPQQGDPLDPIGCYLGEDLEKYLTHPYASPLFGDFKGLPPMLIQSGDCEVLRDEVTLLAHKATLAGVDVRHELYEDAIHVFQACPFLEASRKSFVACRDFVDNSLPMWQSSAPKVLGGNAEEELAGEIDNDETRIVGGDGVEVAEDDTEDIPWMKASSSSHEDFGHSSHEDPSWGTKDHKGENSYWSTPPPTDDDSANELQQAVSGSLTLAADKSPHSPLQRIKSVVHHVVEATYTTFTKASEDPVSPTTPTTRGPSTSLLQQRPNPERRASYHRGPPVAMESLHSSAPKPLMRHSSHADISSLCQDWADSGPANRTVTYKSLYPRAQRSRKNSQTKSLVNLLSPMN